jgi:hypothetical protein
VTEPPEDRDTPANPQGPAEPETELESRVAQVPIAVIKRTTRFSAEVVATMISLASAAFGVVAALAWNTAITSAFSRLGRDGELSALFIYAVVVTFIGVFVIVLLGRLAGRLKAQPVEFKYPAPPPGTIS